MALEKIGDFIVPKWWECQWRRDPCGKRNCRLCGRIIRNRERHIKKGEDPDSWGAVCDDMHRNFQETIALIKKGAKKWGIDSEELQKAPADCKSPPPPSRFVLYKRVSAWQKRAHEIIFIIQQEFNGTTAYSIEDLGWYANLLPTKVYRQLCTRWEKKYQPSEYSEIDHVYTKYILKEIISIAKQAIGELTQVSSAQKAELMLLLSQLIVLESRILVL